MIHRLNIYLDQVMAYAGLPPEAAQQVRHELEDHLLERIADLQRAGASPDDAVFRALYDHGRPREVGYRLRPAFPWIDVRLHGTARGFFAVGPCALGVFACGIVPLGIVACGIVPLGVLACGAVAGGLGFAVGACSAGPVAVGWWSQGFVDHGWMWQDVPFVLAPLGLLLAIAATSVFLVWRERHRLKRVDDWVFN